MIDTISLKTSLIDLAVSGRLSTEFQAEDSVSEIIEKLPTPSNKRKKLLGQTFEYGKQSDIPENWRWILLGEITSYGDMPVKASTSNVSDDTWILDLEDIKAGGELLTKTRAKEKQFAGEKTLFHSGQVLYSKLRPYLKKVLVADEDGISTPELISFDVFGGILPQYIVCCLLDSFTNRAIDKRSYGIKMPRIDAGFMVNLPVPLPPVSEQHYIIERLEAAFSLIDTIENLQIEYTSNQETLKSKLIDAGITGRLTEPLPGDGSVSELHTSILRDKERILKERNGRADKKIKEIDDNVPFDIPEHWKWIRFGDVGLFKKGPFGSALTKSMFVPKNKDTVKVYEQQHAIRKDANIGTYYITKKYFDEKMSGFEVRSGDIIVSCAGTIGETYILPEDIERGVINQALMRITLAEGIDRRFFLYYFDSNLKKSAQEESNGSAIKNIPPFDVMKNWYFPLPPIEEQGRIADKIDELLQYC